VLPILTVNPGVGIIALFADGVGFGELSQFPALSRRVQSMSHSIKADLNRRPVSVMAEWADSLLRDAQKHLGRMDTTLTLAEAKVAVVRRMIERRRQMMVVEGG